MKFQCDPPTAQGITCKFQEVGVHRKGGPDELAKSLAQVPEAVKVGLPPDMKNMCKNVTAIADGLRSGKQPANLPDSRHVFEEWAAAGPRAKNDLQNFWEGMARLCAAPTAENWEALMCQQRSRRAKRKTSAARRKCMPGARPRDVRSGLCRREVSGKSAEPPKD